MSAKQTANRGPRVVTLGESMIVLNPATTGPLRHVQTFHRSLAGAESNVAIGLVRLGITTGWVSRLGNDEFGRYALTTLRGEGVDVSRVVIDDAAPTAVYFKELRGGRDPAVYYYRRGSAASRLGPADISEEYIAGAELLHVTGITPALSDSCYRAVMTAIEKEAYRPTFGSTPAMMEKAMASGMRASATTKPASKSPRMLDSQSWRRDFENMNR